ncbi:porin [Hyphomicrobium sp.]|uniref:porin n=1 Tax=Hyphomicrobium sp. TaxID=82 RepID=UPI003F7141DB
MTAGLIQNSTRRLQSLTLLALAGAMAAASPAAAADLGGNCCADLEERIAELESTTARKGNRKVSLTISGWVNEAVFAWDDGVENNVYVGTNSLEQSRFRFVGDAKIDGDWSAGYTLEIGVFGADSKAFAQDNTGSKNSLVTRKASWFLKSKTFGKLTVGQDGTATYHLLDDADGAATRNYADAEAAAVALGAFKTRSGGVLGAKWTDFMGGFNNATPGQSGRRNVVRYDTPTFAGFTATAAWGEDDMWDTSLTYKGEVGDFALVGKLGYGESTDPGVNGGQCAVGNGDCQWWGAAGTIMHNPTGLYVYAGYAETHIDLTAAQVGADDEATTWFVQGGLEKKFFPIGKTTLFGEFRRDDVGLSKAATGSELDFWAAGVVQNVENAAMDLYVIYRNASGEATTGGVKANLDDLDMVIAGAKIQF